jgi:CBS domain-containing protein
VVFFIFKIVRRKVTPHISATLFKEGDRMKIQDILRVKGPEVLTISEERTVFEAISSMVMHKIGALLVMNFEGEFTGIITERDILRICNSYYDQLKTLPVKEVMTRRVIISNPDDEVEYVQEVMTSNRIRHIPVISNNRLVGLISIGDVVKALGQEVRAENKYLKDYISGKYPA